MSKPISSRALLFIVGISSLFLVVNRDIFKLDPIIPITIMFIVLFPFIALSLDKKISLPIEKPGNDRKKSFLITGAIFFVFLGITFFLSNILKGGEFSLVNFNIIEALKIYSESIIFFSQIPTASVIPSFLLLFIMFAVLIPIGETSILGVATEFLKDNSKINKSNFSRKLWLIILIPALVFAIFHFSSKGFGLEAGVPLIITVLFGITSGFLFHITGQMWDAFLLHMFTNSSAVLATQQTILSSSFLASPFIFILVLGIGSYFFIQKGYLQKLFNGAVNR